MILFFSGTGNTTMAAQRLGQSLGDAVTDICKCPMEMPLSGNKVIWCFPIYSWGVPPIMTAFMRRVRIANAESVPHFMVTTCGDDMGYADQQWRRLMSKRGWTTAEAFSVIMPNIYVCMKGFDVDPSDLASRKLAQAEETLRLIAEDITHFVSAICKRMSPPLKRGCFPRIKSSIIYPWFIRHAMSPKPFHTTSLCTGCGLCAHMCPCHNIEMRKDDDTSGHAVPHHGDKCAMCLRCYHICPNHAVAYGRATVGKGRYINPCLSDLRNNL